MMKIVIKNSLLFLMYLVVSSCVDDNGLFEDDNASSAMKESLTVVTVLQELGITETTVEEDLCFYFNYPLSLGYNTGASIVVSDFVGFKKMVFSQHSNFNVSKVNFPFSVQLNDENLTATIADEAQFNTIATQCGLPTLRNTIDEFIDVCFDYEYPVELISDKNMVQRITALSSLQLFLDNQGAQYQPKHVFPVRIREISSGNSLTANSNFDLYEILNNCKSLPPDCPDPIITIEQVDQNLATNSFNIAVTPFPDAAYLWYVDKVLIPNENKAAFTKSFGPGNYDICVDVLLSQNQCTETVLKTCQFLTAPESCPEHTFEYNDMTKRLTALTTEISASNKAYKWFIDNQIVEENNSSVTNDSILLENLAAGDYEICIETQSEFCSQLSRHCETITISN